MPITISGWTTVAEQPLVLVKEYAFGPGRANAMAVRLPDGSFMIISPSVEPGADADAFAALGGVSALIANNGTHHLGLGPWRAKFPQAVTYAATRAAERIRKKGKNPGQLEPIEKLQSKAGDRIGFVTISGDKIGDVCVRVHTDRGVLFYAGDFIANIHTLPRNPLFKLAFRLTDSAPGLKVFKLFFTFFVADKGAARDALIKELDAHPPAILVPAHGDVVARQDVGPTLVGMLRQAI